MMRELKDTLHKTTRSMGALLVLCSIVIATSSVSAASNKRVQTLQEIRIEGEIAVPQVLFITSRDYPRYRDGLGLKFRLNAIDVARSLDLPKRLRIVPQSHLIKEEGP